MFCTLYIDGCYQGFMAELRLSVTSPVTQNVEEEEEEDIRETVHHVSRICCEFVR